MIFQYENFEICKIKIPNFCLANSPLEAPLGAPKNYNLIFLGDYKGELSATKKRATARAPKRKNRRAMSISDLEELLHGKCRIAKRTFFVRGEAQKLRWAFVPNCCRN